jgi:hypothetical protein
LTQALQVAASTPNYKTTLNLSSKGDPFDAAGASKGKMEAIHDSQKVNYNWEDMR